MVQAGPAGRSLALARNLIGTMQTARVLREVFELTKGITHLLVADAIGQGAEDRRRLADINVYVCAAAPEVKSSAFNTHTPPVFSG